MVELGETTMSEDLGARGRLPPSYIKYSIIRFSTCRELNWVSAVSIVIIRFLPGKILFSLNAFSFDAVLFA